MSNIKMNIIKVLTLILTVGAMAIPLYCSSAPTCQRANGVSNLNPDGTVKEVAYSNNTTRNDPTAVYARAYKTMACYCHRCVPNYPQWNGSKENINFYFTSEIGSLPGENGGQLGRGSLNFAQHEKEIYALIHQFYPEWGQEIDDALEGKLDYIAYIRFDNVIKVYNKYTNESYNFSSEEGNGLSGLYYNYYGNGMEVQPAGIEALGWGAKTTAAQSFKYRYHNYWFITPKEREETEIVSPKETVRSYAEKDELIYTRYKDENGKPKTILYNNEGEIIPAQFTPEEYKTGNSSPEGYDLSEGIPSGKMLHNDTEASSWQAGTDVRVRTIVEGQYNGASKSYPLTEYYWEEEVKYVNGEPVIIGYNTKPEWTGEYGTDVNGNSFKIYIDVEDRDSPIYEMWWVLHSREHSLTYDYTKHYEGNYEYEGFDSGTTVGILSTVSYQYLANTGIFDFSGVNIFNQAYADETLWEESTAKTTATVKGLEKYETIIDGDESTIKSLTGNLNWYADSQYHYQAGVVKSTDVVFEDEEYYLLHSCPGGNVEPSSLRQYNSLNVKADNRVEDTTEWKEKAQKSHVATRSLAMEEIYNSTVTRNDQLTVMGIQYMDSADVVGCNFLTCDNYQKTYNMGSYTDLKNFVSGIGWMSCDQSSAVPKGYGHEYVNNKTFPDGGVYKQYQEVPTLEKITTGSQFNETVPDKEITSADTEIPTNTENGKYATGIVPVYVPLVLQGQEQGLTYSSQTQDTSAGCDWGYPRDLTSGNHCLDGIDGVVNVHTPVISPVAVKYFNKETGAIEDIDNSNTQLYSVYTSSGSKSKNYKNTDTEAEFAQNTDDNVMQLRLDETYLLNWDFAIHRDISQYGKASDTMGEEYSTEYGNAYEAEYDYEYSKYDEFVKAKYVRFPFPVQYNGVFYDVVETHESDELYTFDGYFTPWIELIAPEDYETKADSQYTTYTTENGNTYKTIVSYNHWRQTPFYIPTYAEEVDGKYIYYKVEAYNVDGRFDEEHTEEQEALYNEDYNYIYFEDGDEANYVACYRTPVQVSGYIYDFTIVGTSDKNTIINKEDTTGRISSEHLALCTYKLEMKVGTKNRVGGNVQRYRTDGGVFTQNNNVWTGVLEGNKSLTQNYLLMTQGKSLSWGNMGALWKGTRFSFSLKTMSNLWHDNDSIEITPTFTYIAKDGTQYSMDEIKIYYDSTVENENNTTGYHDMFVEYGSQKDLENTQYVQLNHEQFNDSYYDDEDVTPYHYGDWIQYSADKKGVSVEYYMNNRSECFNMSHISIPSALRLLSGEWEELRRNIEGNGNDGANIVKYSDDTLAHMGINDNTVENAYIWSEEDNIVTFEGVSESAKDQFKDSIQTWYGQYYIPANLYVVVPSKHGYDSNFDLYNYIDQKSQSSDGFTKKDSIFEDGGYLIINFDITAYKDNQPYLVYNGGNSGNRMWEIEDFDFNQAIDEKNGIYASLTDGDCVVVDLSRSVSDKYTSGIFNIN